MYRKAGDMYYGLLETTTTSTTREIDVLLVMKRIKMLVRIKRARSDQKEDENQGFA